MHETDLILFGTQGCHLCDDAEQLIQQSGLSYDYRDIIDDHDLMERFAIKIPVLALPHDVDYVAPLCWPFDQASLLHWYHASATPKDK